jgi:hypothetical protein
LSSRSKRKGGTGDGQIEDAIVVSDTGETGDTGNIAGDQGLGIRSAAAATRDPGEAPMIAAGDAPKDPNPGDGSNFVDRGDVAVDVRADSMAAAQEGPAAVAADPSDGDKPAVAALPDLDTAPEPAAARQKGNVPPPPPPPAAPQKSGGGFWGPVLGGIVAAAAGFGVSEYMNREVPVVGPDPVLQALEPVQQGLAALEAQQQAQQSLAQDQYAGLEGQLAQIAATVAERDTAVVESRLEEVSTQLVGTLDALSGRFESVTGGIEGLEGTLAGVQERLGTVTERLIAVEQRPLSESSATAQAAYAQYEKQIDDLSEDLTEEQARYAALEAEAQARYAALEAELETAKQAAASEMQTVQSQAADLQTEAERTAARAALREAIARIEGALESGSPFAPALDQLPDSIAVPEALTANAETGVATLPQLRTLLPDEARAALDASIRETVSDDPAGRVVAFLRSQTGARSLAPKDGEDPDAILSRAEAMVADGDLAGAIAELTLLPPSGQAEVADWVAQAETRMAVSAGLVELTETLTSEE